MRLIYSENVLFNIKNEQFLRKDLLDETLNLYVGKRIYFYKNTNEIYLYKYYKKNFKIGKDYHTLKYVQVYWL